MYMKSSTEKPTHSSSQLLKVPSKSKLTRRLSVDGSTRRHSSTVEITITSETKLEPLRLKVEDGTSEDERPVDPPSTMRRRRNTLVKRSKSTHRLKLSEGAENEQKFRGEGVYGDNRVPHETVLAPPRTPKPAFKAMLAKFVLDLTSSARDREQGNYGAHALHDASDHKHTAVKRYGLLCDPPPSSLRADADALHSHPTRPFHLPTSFTNSLRAKPKPIFPGENLQGQKRSPPWLASWGRSTSVNDSSSESVWDFLDYSPLPLSADHPLSPPPPKSTPGARRRALSSPNPPSKSLRVVPV